MKTLLVHCSIYIWLLSQTLKATEHLLNARNIVLPPLGRVRGGCHFYLPTNPNDSTLTLISPALVSSFEQASIVEPVVMTSSIRSR